MSVFSSLYRYFVSLITTVRALSQRLARVKISPE